jgi:hypothetical protein
MAAIARRPLYQHRQTGWLMLGSSLIPFVCLAVFVGATPASARELPPELLPTLCAISAIVVGFSWLNVYVTDTHVVFRFGVGLYRRAIALADIRSAAVAPSRWYEGWGIHWTRRGMLYNVGGFETVAIELVDGRKLRVGSDEPARLLAAIERAMTARKPTPR